MVDAIIGDGGSAVFVAADLSSDPDALREIARTWNESLDGMLDILIHNAAVCPATDTLTLADADLEATLAVNIRAPHVLTAALAPAMMERDRAAIVMIGSWMAELGHPFVGLYSATKAAEAQLARSWAAEFGPRGIRVNTVAPGATRAPIDDADDVIARMTAGTPAGKPGTPDDIAAAIAWIVSDDASYIHGAVIPVDGGITATRTG